MTAHSRAAWIVYRNKAVFGARFTARLWRISRAGIEPTMLTVKGDTLEAVRSQLPDGLAIADITEEDRQQGIVEQWIS